MAVAELARFNAVNPPSGLVPECGGCSAESNNHYYSDRVSPQTISRIFNIMQKAHDKLDLQLPTPEPAPAKGKAIRAKSGK